MEGKRVRGEGRDREEMEGEERSVIYHQSFEGIAEIEYDESPIIRVIIGLKTIVEHSEQFPVRIEDNRYVKCIESDTHLRVCKGVKPSLPRLRRTV